jgi:DnaD/phage-associated family protein
MKFNGFPEGKVRFTRLPDPLFTQLLPQIDNLDEFKVLLYFFWRLERMEGAFRFLRRPDFLEDERFMQALGSDAGQASQALDEALQRGVQRGSLLLASLETEAGPENLYFLNSAKGRAAVRAIQRGEWRPGGEAQVPVSLDLSLESPNIYRLYEEHIGPLTPMIAEKLHDAEDSYPPKWIEDAFRIAVENNVRRWSYVEAILKRWQEGGRDERTDRRDTEKDRRRYIEGEFSEFIEH